MCFALSLLKMIMHYCGFVLLAIKKAECEIAMSLKGFRTIKLVACNSISVAIVIFTVPPFSILYHRWIHNCALFRYV